MKPDPEETQAYPILSAGTEVQHYRIVERLGAGGMGEVYLAEDATLDRRVALKFPPPAACSNEKLRARFLREARAAARLDHPNIVSVHEVGEAAGRPFIAMQYVAGPSLRHHCTQERLPIQQILTLVAPIARGLAKAHDSGIVHRDIKPANILLDDGNPVIVDFGLASMHDAEALTQAGTAIGTAPYMSPEQAQGLPTDHRSDLFSLGVVLYELVTGHTPFHRDNVPATLHSIVHDELPVPRHPTCEVPDELVRILRKCLAKSRDERYASAHDLAADLERLERAFATGDPLAGRTRPRPSIAVLPFTNMSSDPENEFFSDGLTEELLNVLAKNPAWRITGRTSSFAFKGKQEDLREIGRKLGVETLLEGSVRKAGNRVRITAQLVNATDGFHLWSETYDRVLEDIFDVQDDIAQAVAMAMNVTLLGAATPRHTPDAESHALTMRAKQAALQMSRSSMTVAVDLYRSAIERDAEYAAAWAGLARVLALSSGAGHFDSARGARESRDAADKALSLDPELAEAHEARGIIAFAFEHQLDKAGEHFRKAYELAPNNCQVLQSLALHEAVQGHFEEMLRLEAVAIELDPLNPEAYLHYARFLYWADKNVEAEAAIRRALELSPDMTSARALLLCVLVAQGRTEEAHEVGMAEPGKGYRLCVVAITHHLLGRSSQSNEALAALTDMGDQWAFQVAAVHAMRGEANEAFTWLQRALDSGDPGAPTLTIHPMLRSLHGDPRWQKMLQRVKLQA